MLTPQILPPKTAPVADKPRPGGLLFGDVTRLQQQRPFVVDFCSEAKFSTGNNSKEH